MSNSSVQVKKTYNIVEDGGYAEVELEVFSGEIMSSSVRILSNLEYEDDFSDLREAVNSLESSLVEKAVENYNG